MNITTELDDNENLIIKLADVSFTDYRHLIELRDTNGLEQHAFEKLLPDHYALPEDMYGMLGFITNAPILTDNNWWNFADDKQEFLIEMNGADSWFFPKYELENPFETLIRKKTVVFKSTNR